MSYDIINNDNRALSGVLEKNLMDIKLNYKKKCVGEYNDLYHIFNPNFSSKYQKNINENKKIYKNYKGVFENMYDACHRNGNLIELFKNPKGKKEEPRHNNSTLKTKWASNSNRIKNAKNFAKFLLKGKFKESKDNFFSKTTSTFNNTFSSVK